MPWSSQQPGSAKLRGIQIRRLRLQTSSIVANIFHHCPVQYHVNMTTEPSLITTAASEKPISQAKPAPMSPVPMPESGPAIEAGYSQSSKGDANESSNNGTDTQPAMKSDDFMQGLPLVITVSALVFVMV